MNHPHHESARNFTTEHLGLVDEQIRTLITMLLHGLLDEIADIRHAAVLIETGDGPAETFARAGRSPMDPDDAGGIADIDREPDAKRIDLSAGLARSGQAVLVISVGDDQERIRDVARRYLLPITISLNLVDELRLRRSHAQDAVRAVESTALLDLATGVLMARRPMDPRSARTILQAWLERSGIPIEELSTSALLELLTEDL